MCKFADKYNHYKSWIKQEHCYKWDVLVATLGAQASTAVHPAMRFMPTKVFLYWESMSEALPFSQSLSMAEFMCTALDTIGTRQWQLPRLEARAWASCMISTTIRFKISFIHSHALLYRVHISRLFNIPIHWLMHARPTDITSPLVITSYVQNTTSTCTLISLLLSRFFI